MNNIKEIINELKSIYNDNCKYTKFDTELLESRYGEEICQAMLGSNRKLRSAIKSLERMDANE